MSRTKKAQRPGSDTEPKDGFRYEKLSTEQRKAYDLYIKDYRRRMRELKREANGENTDSPGYEE